MITLEDAIKAINPEAEFSCNPADSTTGITWLVGSPIAAETLEAKKVELQAAYDAKQYQRDRKKAYPDIGDQLDMQYHDKKDGTTTWEDAVQAVKDAHPKP